MTFEEFFRQATGNPDPYPYQARFAKGKALPQLLSVPTGVGKTATAVLGWLWRRRYATDNVRASTPRRLVFCLPMRTLVEQTRDACVKWFKNLELGGEEVGVHLLMGGEDASDWDEYPESDAVIIGTQDMLLSRALNRGYGMSRYRWAIHFGLLNNDCLWVLDETQLMGVGLTTSVQLAGLRKKLSTYCECRTLWMSATIDNEALETIDHSSPDPDKDGITLDDSDHVNLRVQQLLNASKPICPADLTLSAETQKTYEKTLADQVLNAHHPGTLTLVVVNTVERSQTLFRAIQQQLAKSGQPAEVALIHSRYRPADRQSTQSAALNEETIPETGRIVIATQAIEAGVDISATTLFTELAPWASMVQRFGRCNRRGVCGRAANPEATIHWIDIDMSDGKASKFTFPYEPDVLDSGRAAVSSLQDVGLQSLSSVTVDEERPVVHVLRRKDLVDLFDTTPDLSGKDLDVSRYIRDCDDTDVQIYWRDWDLKASGGPPSVLGENGSSADDFPGPVRDELCSVSIAKARDFITKKLKSPVRAWAWDPLAREWTAVGKNNVRAGLTILLHVDAGGYDADLGWTGDPKHKPLAVVADDADATLAAMGQDDTEGAGHPLSLTQHLKDVVHYAEELGAQVFDEQIPWQSVLAAARWHDVGKAHAAFQTAMRDFPSVGNHPECDSTLWAKAGERGRPDYRVEISASPPANAVSGDATNSEFNGEAGRVALSVESSAIVETKIATNRREVRTGFRHELASALAWLQHCATSDASEEHEIVDLVAFLIAAHHGKVRLSIRSMPNENKPADPQRKFARGIWEGDSIPAVELDDGTWSIAVVSLNLDLMALGESESGPSWLARMLALRDSPHFGPFRLAFLETLVRVADWRGSANPATGEQP